MPTILTHAALPMIAGLAAGRQRISAPLVLVGMVCAVLPDLDVIGFRLGIAYGAPFGHRGASHSLTAAVLLGLMAAVISPLLRSPGLKAFLFVTAAAASHGLTDMLTNGGRGVALLWPVSDARLFAPIRPIEVSAIGVAGIRSGSFWPTLASEFIWLILPAIFLAILYRRAVLPHIDLAKARS